MNTKETNRTERQGIGIAMIAFESLGFAFREQKENDFGIDAHAELILSEHPTGQIMGIQLKSGSSYLSESIEGGYVFRTDKKHADYWQKHALPILICLCDVSNQVVYWQAVTDETLIPTGKGYKIIVPSKQTIEVPSFKELCDLLTPIVPSDRYTIFKTDDTSHGAAKRYSFEAVINGNATKAEIAAIIRQITNDGAKRKYHRNHLVEGQWGDSDAHVVWSFIYPSAEDHKRRNYICRSIWIREDLEENYRPIDFDGENVGDNIIVDWSKDYNFLAIHVSNNTLTKEDYFTEVLPHIEELKTSLSVIEKGLVALSRTEIDESLFLASSNKWLQRINIIYSSINGLPYAPFECRDMDAKLESFISFLHNVWLFYSDTGRSKWDKKSRLKQSLQQLSYAREALYHLEYELSKIR
ncbi:MAG: DUF4365 domain-containing protein [Pseudomonadota bacterium]